MVNGRRNVRGKEAIPSIDSESTLDLAIQKINSLLDRGDSLSSAEENELDALSDRVREYEMAHHPIRKAALVDIFRFLMDAKGVTVAQVARATGIPRADVAAMVAGKKPAVGRKAQALGHYFRVRPSLFRAREVTEKVEAVSITQISQGSESRQFDISGAVSWTTNSVAQAVEWVLGVCVAFLQSPPRVPRSVRSTSPVIGLSSIVSPTVEVRGRALAELRYEEAFA